MEQFLAALDGAWRVLLVGMLLGAGLPALFAVGIRALAWGTGGDAEISESGVTLKPHPLGLAIAYTMFAIVILAVLLGVGYIVAHGLGWELTFNGILPQLTRK